MAVFSKEALESFKYTVLVKLAKEHNVYRRYAPKTELVEKLTALSEPPPESLNDVSMPSFMVNDESDFEESDLVQDSTPKEKNIPSSRRVKEVEVNQSSLRSPLSENLQNVTLNGSGCKSIKSVARTRNKLSASQNLRRSLAGPSKASIQRNFKTNSKSEEKHKSLSTALRITRQRTFEVDTSEDGSHEELCDLTAKQNCIKEIDSFKSSCEMKREGTYNIEDTNLNVKNISLVSQVTKLKRDGTFDIADTKEDSQELLQITGSRKLRRDGTFEVESTPSGNACSALKNSKNSSGVPTSTPREPPHTRKLSKGSLQTPHQSKINCISTPSSIKPNLRSVNGQSIPRRFVTSRARLQECSSPEVKSFGSKSKIPSVMNDILKRKEEVSTRKLEGAMGQKPVLAKKIPDFGAIHKRLFGKMESLVDSRQKVIDKANSVQKSQVKLQIERVKSPKNRVVRKLISPKAGKSKLVSPKPVTTSVFASNVVPIQKRPSIGKFMTGISKLQSPRSGLVNQPKGKVAGEGNKVGLHSTEQSRKELLKASVMGRKPLKRSSPMAKAKQALQTVRLNKRFELQMKHRLAQQGDKA